MRAKRQFLKYTTQMLFSAATYGPFQHTWSHKWYVLQTLFPVVQMGKHALNLEVQTTPKKAKDTTPPIPLSPSEITSPNQTAVFNGVIASVSPVRFSKYFDGELTDGDTTLRFVDFRKQQQQLLHSLCLQQQPIKIQNCQIQFNKFSHQLEILSTSTYL